MWSRMSRGSRGFTLLEVMVSVAILGFISIGVWQALSGNLRAKERVEKRDEFISSVTLVLERIAEEIQMAFLHSENSPAMGRAPNGEILTKTAFMGRNVGWQDELTFNSFSHIRYQEGAKECDQAEIAYKVVSDPDLPGLWLLKKRDNSPIDAHPEEGGKERALLSRLKVFNLRYYDERKGEWSDEWDTTRLDWAGRLPTSVEVTLKVQDPENEEVVWPFKIVASPGLAPGPNDF